MQLQSMDEIDPRYHTRKRHEGKALAGRSRLDNMTDFGQVGQ